MTLWKEQIARLFALHRKQIERMIFRRVHDRDAAADIMQTVFTKLLATEGRQNEEESTKILFAAARNESYNYRQGINRRSSILSSLVVEQIAPVRPSSHDEVEGAEAMFVLEEALAKLPGRTREIFIRRCLHDDSNADIAREMRISVRAVEKHLVRAMEHCRSALEDYLAP
ncbi:RNA polymerase sigma factor [Rhizobium terrae]|uniref:RNA polymerase sigma factor n=1 Tax=Rhizobium terrae TaxID=2171756 RepID=UPI000E3C3CCA|nr:sigma-70 family RNA polymerase sigma factor [Rhizobium terrae]